VILFVVDVFLLENAESNKRVFGYIQKQGQKKMGARCCSGKANKNRKVPSRFEANQPIQIELVVDDKKFVIPPAKIVYPELLVPGEQKGEELLALYLNIHSTSECQTLIVQNATVHMNGAVKNIVIQNGSIQLGAGSHVQSIEMSNSKLNC